MSVLEIEGVSKRIGKRLIIDDISMKVEAGEVYGFLGPNGAGKTTTIRMIVGLATPSKGSIRVLGHDVFGSRRQALMNLGAIVENPETYSYLTGRQNLMHYARLSGIAGARKRIDELAAMVNLNERIDDKVKRYSLGMRQRLGVAQALLADPKLLVLDEPTNGLDPAGMREFREMMRNLAGSGMSVFVSSHLLSEIQLMCDRVAVLKEGRIIAQRRVDELVTGAQSAVKVQVSDADKALQTLQQAQSLHIERTGETGLRIACGPEAVPGVLRTLITAGYDVYSAEPVRDTLEEAFLQMTTSGDVNEPSANTKTGGTARG